MITRDGLLEKRAEFSAQHEQHIANANAVDGAIQLIDELLAELDKEDAQEEVS